MSIGENAASRRVSRRDALRAAGAGAGAGVAGFLVACGGGGGSARTLPQLNPVQIQADAAVAGALVQGERAAIAAYRLGASHMQGADRRIAERFRAQEEAHERALERALRSLNAAPPPRRPDADYVAGFPRVTDAESALRFALDVENTQISAYSDALGTVATPALRAVIASILTVEAEHMSVILGQLHEPQAPQALVTGTKPT